MKSIDEMTQAELRECENKCHDRRMLLAQIECRERQVSEIFDTRLEPEPGAEIYSYCEDLIYHAKRLNRRIGGRFNGTHVLAFADSSPADLCRKYSGMRAK